jgi:hypothetical protein
MSLQNKVIAGLAQLPPEDYPTKALAALLKENGAIDWGSNWVSVKKIIEAQPDWHWNGERHPTKSRWIKSVPPPVCPVIQPRPEPDPDETPKGPVSTALFRMESMLEALCNSLGIAERPVPADIAKELSRINETPCRDALMLIIPELDAFAKRGAHYIKKRQLAVWRGTIHKALGK